MSHALAWDRERGGGGGRAPPRGAPAPGPAADACGGFTGIQGAGTRWDYDYDGEAGVGVFYSQVTNYDAGSGAIHISSASETAITGAFTVTTTEADYLCDADGFWLLSLRTDYTATVGGLDYSGFTEVIYLSPALVTPHGLEVGDAWTSSQVGTLINDNGVYDVNQTVESAVTGQESVTVSAGTYDALVVEATADGSTARTWVAEGVGTVKGEESELTAYAP